MARYSEDQRGRIGEKLLDLGNIAAGAMLFGQVVSNRQFDMITAFLGLVVLIACYLVGLRIMRGGGKQ
jgi:predicted MFS family arabinose efflux permease